MPSFLQNANFNKYQLLNARLQNLATAPSGPVEGQVYYDTALDKIGVYNAQTSSWDYLGTGGGGVTASSTDTFTNKTFDANGTGNVLSNVEVADFAAAAIVTAGETIGSNNNDTTIPTSAAVKAYADALIGAADAMVFKGGIDASTNPNYPAAVTGDTYRITVAGKIGGASGPNVTVGDTLINAADAAAGTHAAVGASWTIIQANVEAATTSTLGLVQLASASEASAQTDSTKAVVSSALTGYTRKYAVSYGDGAATSYTITHNLGTLDVTWEVYTVSGGAAVIPDVTHATTNTLTVSHAAAPTSNQYRIVVVG